MTSREGDERTIARQGVVRASYDDDDYYYYCYYYYYY